MEAVADLLKGFAKSTQAFAAGISSWNEQSKRRRPIEILKRLQKEAFSDLLKLRDRQDKVERILSVYKFSKGSPFQETSTRVRGDVDMLGALLMINDVDEHSCDLLRRARINTGVHSRITFETTVREHDTLAAEFVARDMNQDDVLGTSLLLSKLFYESSIRDWCSMVAIPVGAQCKDVAAVATSSHHKRRVSSYCSLFGPPLLNEQHGGAIALLLRKAKVVASLAQFTSRLIEQPGYGFVRYFTTFGQLAYQLSRSTRLSIMGKHQIQGAARKQAIPGALIMPFGLGKKFKTAQSLTGTPELPVGMHSDAAGSVALMVESELDESTRIGAWLEMQNSNSRNLQWNVSVSDMPEDEIGWGLSLGGSTQGPKTWDHFQVETFLNINYCKKFNLQPAFIYLMEGTNQFPGLMLRCNWSL